MNTIQDPLCSCPDCPNPVVIGLSVLIPSAAAWWCVEHVDHAERHLRRIQASLRAVLDVSAHPETEDAADRDGDGGGGRHRVQRGTADRLQEVAAAYVKGGGAEVMRALQVSRSQAFRLIRLARDAGLLPEP